MFTGIVERTGRVRSVRRSGKAATVFFDVGRISSELRVGDSAAINGVCLTIEAKRGSQVKVQVVEETLKKTNLGDLNVGDRVNVELPLRASDRLGGHIVLGHVDAVGKISSIRQLKKSWVVRIEIPRRFMRYLVLTGSVAIDGVSLTVAQLDGSAIEVALIPQTMARTNFKDKKVGDAVNLEFDVLGKYIDRLLSNSRSGRER